MSEARDSIALRFYDKLVERLEQDPPPDVQWILAYHQGFWDGAWEGLKVENEKQRKRRQAGEAT